MRPFRPLSTREQLANYLREEILNGRLCGEMPGIKQLVQTLGVNSVTMTHAYQQLEREGLIIARGNRRKRLIAKLSTSMPKSMRVGLLYYDRHNRHRADALELRQALTDSGHTPVTAPKSMQELGLDSHRITRHVDCLAVDAWLVYAGSSEVLHWFADNGTPAFAIYGSLIGVNIAGMAIRRSHLMEALIKKLVDLGHRRIVLLVHEEGRKPVYGPPECFFLKQLESHGIKTGAYNIPDWEESPEGLEECLNKLFAHTPPSAILIDDAVLFHPVQAYLANRGITSPGHISLICNDYTESFDWARPSIAHMKWDYRPTIRRVLQWIHKVSGGIEDKKISYTEASFHEGCTIGPVPTGKNLPSRPR
ncbi:MAG: substrate-binding domain-containing protein [Luteolibacter sp.]